MSSTSTTSGPARGPGDGRSPSSWALEAPQLRVGDEERSACAAQLADAFASGRLSPAEHDARLSSTLTATTAGELRDLLHDLPVTHRGEPTLHRWPPVNPVLVAMLRVTVFQFALVLLAYCIGVDLESESTSAAVIALEVWTVGTLSGAAGHLIGRGSRPSRSEGTGQA